MTASENLNSSQFKQLARKVMPYRVEKLRDGLNVYKVNQSGVPYNNRAFSYVDSLRQGKPYKSPGSSRMMSGEGH